MYSRKLSIGKREFYETSQVIRVYLLLCMFKVDFSGGWCIPGELNLMSVVGGGGLVQGVGPGHTPNFRCDPFLLRYTCQQQNLKRGRTPYIHSSHNFYHFLFLLSVLQKGEGHVSHSQGGGVGFQDTAHEDRCFQH